MFSMKKIYVPLLLTTLLLTGCAPKGNHIMYQNGDVVFNNADTYLEELSLEYVVKNYIESGDSISIYYGLEGCSSCEYVFNNLNRYIKDNGQKIYYVSSNKVDLNTLNLGYSDFKVSNLYLFDDGQLFKTFHKDALNNPKMIKNNLSKEYKKSKAYIFNDVNNFTNFISNNDCDAFVYKKTEKDANEWYLNNYKNNLRDGYTAIYYDHGDSSLLLEKYGVQSNSYFTYIECSNGSYTVKDSLVYYM